MTEKEICAQLVSSWSAHNEINLKLLQKMPAGGFSVVPVGSRGRTVAEQFGHLHRSRVGWLGFHRTGKRPQLPGVKGAKYTRKSLTADFKRSGKEIERFLRTGCAGEAKVGMFGGQLVRFLAYLISHESHHRGSILLTLKQNGMNKQVVALQGLWWRWHRAK